MREDFVTNNILSKYAKNITSQFGEDGIIEQIFNTIGDSNKWCVEFGAWDGKNLSNTYNLIKNKNWQGVLIEASAKKFEELIQTYKENPNAHCIKELVSFEGSQSLDNILSTTDIPENFDLISIDVDGNDYHIWDSLKKYNPKVVIVEFNPSFPNDIFFVQDPDFSINHGNSLLALIELGRSKGYELVGTTSVNGIFVKKEYYPLFNIADNSIHWMYNPQPYSTKIFQLYDGSLFLGGLTKLIWHGVTIASDELQILPRALRNFPDRVK